MDDEEEDAQITEWMQCDNENCGAWSHLLCARAQTGRQCPNCSVGLFVYSQTTMAEDREDEEDDTSDEDTDQLGSNSSDSD